MAARFSMHLFSPMFRALPPKQWALGSRGSRQRRRCLVGSSRSLVRRSATTRRARVRTTHTCNHSQRTALRAARAQLLELQRAAVPQGRLSLDGARRRLEIFRESQEQLRAVQQAAQQAGC